MAMERKIIDYEEGLHRFVDMKDIYEKYLRDFKNDPSIETIKKTFKKKAVDNQNAIHSLKGVSGNLSLNRLFDVCSQAMVYIRAGHEFVTDEIYQNIINTYDEAIQEIQKVFGRWRMWVD